MGYSLDEGCNQEVWDSIPLCGPGITELMSDPPREGVGPGSIPASADILPVPTGAANPRVPSHALLF